MQEGQESTHEGPIKHDVYVGFFHCVRCPKLFGSGICSFFLFVFCLGKLAQSVMVQNKGHRAKDETDEVSLKKALKEIKGGLNDKKYLNDDPEDVCFAYYDLMKFLCSNTERICVQKIEKVARDVFESERSEIRAFARAVQDAFNYVKGKAYRVKDSSKQPAEVLKKLVQHQKNLCLENQTKKISKVCSPAKVSKSAAVPAKLPTKPSRSSSGSSSEVQLPTRSSEDVDILALYGFQADPDPHDVNNKRSLKKELSNASVISLSSVGSPSPVHSKQLVASVAEAATPEATLVKAEVLEARGTVKRAKVEVSVERAKDRARISGLIPNSFPKGDNRLFLFS